MESRRRREIAFAAVALIVLTVAVAAYRFRTIAPATVASQPARTSTPAASALHPGPSALKSKGLGDVDLKALSEPHGELPQIVRDPFRFKPKPPPPPPPVPIGMRPADQLPAVPVGPPPLPRIALKFFGIVQTKKGPLAQLTDGRGGTYLGFEGATIDGRYRIMRIGVESIDVAYLDGRGRQTIKFTGQGQ